MSADAYRDDLFETARRRNLSARQRACCAATFLSRSGFAVNAASVVAIADVDEQVADEVVAELKRDPNGHAHVGGVALQVSKRGARIRRDA